MPNVRPETGQGEKPGPIQSDDDALLAALGRQEGAGRKRMPPSAVQLGIRTVAVIAAFTLAIFIGWIIGINLGD